jgi:hypothetical protein
MDAHMGWTGLGLGLLVLAVGVTIGRITSAATKRIRQLELELARAHDEMASYRANVNQHFIKTAELLGILTANYRAVYEHLAAGAKTLCTEEVVELSPAALRDRLLAGSNETPTPPTDLPVRHATTPQLRTSSPRQAAPTPMGTASYPDRLSHVNHIEDTLVADTLHEPVAADVAQSSSDSSRDDAQSLNGRAPHSEANGHAHPAGNPQAGSEHNEAS